MQPNFTRFAGICAILAGIAGACYLVAFVILQDPGAALPALFLLIAGLLGVPVLVALYLRLRAVDEGFAFLGLILGAAGALGAAVHSAFDLSNDLHPPPTNFTFPNPIDPRGFLTFFVAGLGTIVIAWLILRGAVFARLLGWLGILAGALLVALYLAYLLTLDPGNAIVITLIFAAGIAQPLWYLFLGYSLLGGSKT